jgi:hypothetical protein
MVFKDTNCNTKVFFRKNEYFKDPVIKEFLEKQINHIKGMCHEFTKCLAKNSLDEFYYVKNLYSEENYQNQDFNDIIGDNPNN